jgi:hypothetical protein
MRPYGAEWWNSSTRSPAKPPDNRESLRSLEHGAGGAEQHREPTQLPTRPSPWNCGRLPQLLSATTLAGAIGTPVKCVTELPDRFVVISVANGNSRSSDNGITAWLGRVRAGRRTLFGHKPPLCFRPPPSSAH